MKAGFCIIKGHETYNTQYICTLKDCKLSNKWICAECQLLDLHQHKQSNNSHMMNQQDFLELIIKQANPYLDWKKTQRTRISECIQILKNSIQLMNDLIKQLYMDFSKIQEYEKSYEIQKIIKIAKDSFFSLSNEQIKSALNGNFINAKFDQKISQDITKAIIKNYQDLLTSIQGNNRSGQNVRQSSISLSQSVNMKQSFQLQTQQSFTALKFENQTEIYKQCHMQTAQISQDERFFVSGGYDKKLQIFDIQTVRCVKEIYLDNVAFICRFTKDNQHLVCGDMEGIIYCYEINNHFHETFNQKVHSDWINDIVSVDNDSCMSCSDDKSIIITNFKQNRQLLNIEKAHEDFIKGIDYDQSQDIIISCSADKSIKLFNRKNGKLQFEQQNAHENIIHQIQLLENNNLLSSDNLSLSLWQIDYEQMKLFKIREIKQWNINFTSVSNNQRVVLICRESVKILDNNLKLVQSIDHQIKEFYCNFIQYYSLFQDQIIEFHQQHNNSWKMYQIKYTQNQFKLLKDNEQYITGQNK